MPSSDGTYDFYEHVSVGLRAMILMLEDFGCWREHVHDVSTSNVIKTMSSYRDGNVALLHRYWYKAGLASFRCLNGCTTKLDEMIDRHQFVMMSQESMPQSAEKFFFDGGVSFYLQCKLQFLWVFLLEPSESGLELRLYKISGHIEDTDFTPNPHPEKRGLGYLTLDGASSFLFCSVCLLRLWLWCVCMSS
jgi:hypothetical protein